MSSVAHKIYISFLVLIVIASTLFFSFEGFSYYQTNIEERFFHPDHNLLKPSGLIGHGLGVVGSFLVIIGIITYMMRKRIRVLSRYGSLKFWLEMHIFLCTLGPVLILFHTAFKFGGLVAVSFWSMVLVVLSGIAGRFIYIQIPRNIEGRVLSLTEIQRLKNDLDEDLKRDEGLNTEASKEIISAINNPESKTGIFRKYIINLKTIRIVKKVLRKNKFPKPMFDKILAVVKSDILLKNKIERLALMQNLFKYWHVVHLPFSLIMIIIMFIHVAVTVAFGYKWIF